jgi:biopolymer transport protein ExbD
MNASSDRSDDSMITGINVTPLVDVALVLLVILMVTATYIAAQTIPMDLPKAATGENTSTTLAISLEANGALWLDGKRMTLPELRRALKREARARDRRAIIAADGATAHRQVISVIDLLRQEGITQFAINVQPSELGNDG